MTPNIEVNHIYILKERMVIAIDNFIKGIGDEEMSLRSFLDLIGQDENYKVNFMGKTIFEDMSNDNVDIVLGEYRFTSNKEKPDLNMYHDILSRHILRIRIVDIEIGNPYYEITLDTF